MSRAGWWLVVGCLALPAGTAGQELPAEPETEITIDKANHFGGGIGFGGPLGVAASVQLLHGLGADVREGDERAKATCAKGVRSCISHSG